MTPAFSAQHVVIAKNERCVLRRVVSGKDSYWINLSLRYRNWQALQKNNKRYEFVFGWNGRRFSYNADSKWLKQHDRETFDWVRQVMRSRLLDVNMMSLDKRQA